MRALFLLVIFTSVYLNAQTVKDQILANSWSLIEINIEGEIYIPPSNEEIGIITMGIEPESETMYWFHSEICSSDLSGLISWNTENQFSFWDFAGGFQCTFIENQNFENLYASFYGVGGANGAPMNCSIVENTNNSLTLTIHNQFDDSVTYTNEILSVQNYEKININVYPNPVLDRLTIENPDFITYTLKIGDATGKIVMTKKFSSIQTTVDLENLQKGIYFLVFEENGIVIKMDKIIKK